MSEAKEAPVLSETLRELAEPLTELKLQFALQVVVRGRREAGNIYQELKPNIAQSSARQSAWRWMQDPNILAFIQAMREETLGRDLMSLSEKRALCMECATDPDVSWSNRLKAIMLDAKLAGDLDNLPDHEASRGVDIENVKQALARTLEAQGDRPRLPGRPVDSETS